MVSNVEVPEPVVATRETARAAGPPRHALPPEPTRKPRSVVREIIGLFGEILVTLGAFLLLFVGWQLWWTDVVADADAEEVVTAMEVVWDDPDSPEAQALIKDKKIPQEAWGLVRIPRFGLKYAKPLYEGTDRATLRRGVGHYTGTVMPGEIGNFSMAGHRTTYGKPFNKIHTLKKGDYVIIETQESYFVYQITEHEIVLPSENAVIAPVPDEKGVEPTEAMMTMTSCHPEFSSRQRYVQHGVFVTELPRIKGGNPDLNPYLEVAE